MTIIPTAQAFSIENPIAADNFGEIIDMIVQNLLVIVIPIGVIMIVWAGFYFLTSAGNPARIQKGKDILKYTTLGLVIIFIGGGFIDLIQSILSGRN